MNVYSSAEHMGEEMALLRELVLQAIAKAKPHTPGFTWYIEPSRSWELERAFTIVVTYGIPHPTGGKAGQLSFSRHVRLFISAGSLIVTYNSKEVSLPLVDPDSLAMLVGLIIGWAHNGPDVPFHLTDTLIRVE